METMLGFFLISGLIGLICLLLVIAAFAFWIWMLIHAVTNNALGTGEKVAWVLVILFLHVIGALIYFIIGFPKAA